MFKAITVRIKTLYYRESMGWLRTLYRAAIALLTAPHLNLPGFMILLCLCIIRPFKRVTLYVIGDTVIAGLAVAASLLPRELQLEKTQKRRGLHLGIISGRPANKQLLTMFKREFPIIQSPLLHEIVEKSALGRTRFCKIRLPFREGYQLNSGEPTLHFTACEEDKGKKLLSGMGIDDVWFVCFHSRDSAYIANQWEQRVRFIKGAKHWSTQDYRNCDVRNYLEAAKYIISSGGFAVRMGYQVAEKLPDLNNPRIIDYASYHRTDFGDIYLPAKCKFFLGSTSGITLIATTFHVPVALANYIPLECSPLLIGDLYIPKRIWFREEKRFLTFREILESGAGSYFYGDQYEKAGLETVENTAEEILDLAKEMNERLDGNFEYTEEDEELQNRFRSLYQPHHLCYGFPSRMGARFLRQNKELLF